MSKTIKIFIALSMLAIGALCTSNIYAASDKVVAVVNEHVITQSELNAGMAALRQHLAHYGNVSGLSASKINIRQRALDDLIDRELQLQMAQRGNIQVSEAAIDNAISNITKRNKISLEQLKQELQKQGKSYASFRKQIREDMLIGSVVQQVLGPKIKINEQEVDDFLRNAPTPKAPSNQEYHCIDILVPTAEHATDKDIAEAKNIATTVLEKLRGGAEIADAIKGVNYAGKELQVSDLGWRTVNDLPTIFSSAITKLKPRDVAGQLVAPNGVHVIRLVEVRGDTLSASSPKMTREDAREMVYHSKLTKLLKPWLQQLRMATYVKIVDDK